VGPLIRNLERYVRLSDDDRRAIDDLRTAPVVDVPPRGALIHEGDKPSAVRLIISGWACRFKGLPDGRRQIVGFFIPGDFCDPNVCILDQMDHAIGALTRVNYLAVPAALLRKLGAEHPRLAQALLWHELVNSSIQREWLLNIGQRTAFERLAHLVVEIYVRLRAVHLTRDRAFDFPITQTDLADATGLTAVHVNRTLQELRREGLIELTHRQLRILDLERLMGVAMFNANYLHLDRGGHDLDAGG
jgi:CRP-like cAMP-binding protein